MYGFLMRMKSPQGGFKMHDEGREAQGEGLVTASHCPTGNHSHSLHSFHVFLGEDLQGSSFHGKNHGNSCRFSNQSPFQSRATVRRRDGHAWLLLCHRHCLYAAHLNGWVAGRGAWVHQQMPNLGGWHSWRRGPWGRPVGLAAWVGLWSKLGDAERWWGYVSWCFIIPGMRIGPNMRYNDSSIWEIERNWRSRDHWRTGHFSKNVPFSSYPTVIHSQYFLHGRDMIIHHVFFPFQGLISYAIRLNIV